MKPSFSLFYLLILISDIYSALEFRSFHFILFFFCYFHFYLVDIYICSLLSGFFFMTGESVTLPAHLLPYT